MDHVSHAPHRVQDRNRETVSKPMGTFYEGEFRNEPNTDWSLPANRNWAEKIRADWQKGTSSDPVEIPLVIAGQTIYANRQTVACLDPSRFRDEIRCGQVSACR